MTADVPYSDKPILTYEYELDAPPEKVWRALTVPEFLQRWLVAPSPADSGEQTELASLSLLESETGRYVRYAMGEKRDQPAGDIVTFLIDPNDAGGTTFRIVHEARPAAKLSVTAANGNQPALLRAA